MMTWHDMPLLVKNWGIQLLTHCHFSMFQLLYKEGARVFWIHNMDPIGCLPFSVMLYQPKAHNLDQNGCVKPQNEMAKEFNRLLKDKVSQLRTQLPSAAITYVDVYSAKYALISDAKNQGNCRPTSHQSN